MSAELVATPSDPSRLVGDLSLYTGADRAQAVALGFLLGYRGRTRAAYTRDLADYGAWCSARNLDPLDATRADVEQYAREMEEVRGLTLSTVARRLTSLAGFYRYAAAEGVLARSPAEHVRRPKVGQESPTMGLDRPELLRLLAAARDAGPRYEALFTLLVLNGLRVSEALGANVEDLGTSRGHRTMTITAKGGRRDVIALAPQTGAALDAYLDGRTSGPVFATSTGGRLDQPAVFRTVRRLAATAGIDKVISPHSLRHSAITAALDDGVSLRDVQDFARHADPRTTRRYDRSRHNLDRHATYRIAAFLGAAAS